MSMCARNAPATCFSMEWNTGNFRLTEPRPSGSGEPSNAQIAKPHRRSVILQADRAGAHDVLPLAMLLEQLDDFRPVQRVFQHADAVQPMLDAPPADHEPRRIPFAG